MKLLHVIMALQAAAVATAEGAADHPIVRVMEKLKDLRRQGKVDGENEALAFQKYSHWCSNEIEKETDEISVNNENITSLETKLDGLSATIAALTDEIVNLTREISERESAETTLKSNFTDDETLLTKKISDLDSTVTAIGGAITALKDSRPASMLTVRSQVKRAAVMAASEMSEEGRQTIHAFLQQEEPNQDAITQTDSGDKTEGGVRQYDFKSDNVIELLKKLKLNFEDQHIAAKKELTNATNSKDLAVQASQAAITAATTAKTTKENLASTAEGDKGVAEGDLKAERSDLKQNQDYKATTVGECSSAASDFETRSEARSGEQTAILEAVKILEKVTGVRSSDHAVAEKSTDAGLFVQVASVSVPSSTVSKREAAMRKAIELITGAGKVAHNAQLLRLGQQLRVAKGPFKQIKNMIQKMIFHLNKEQTNEDSKKNWCDNELDVTDQQLAEKESQIGKLEAKELQLESRIGKLGRDITQLDGEISDKQDYIKDETEMRTANKVENKKTIEDSKTAQAALAQAISVLTKYYKDSGAEVKEMYEFIQQPSYRASGAGGNDMGTFSATDGSTVVLDLLTTTMADYDKLEAEATAEEERAEELYEEDMGASKTYLAGKRNDVKVKTAELTTKEDTLATTQSQLKKANNQKDALDQYLVDLTGDKNGELAYKKGVRSMEGKKVDAPCSRKTEKYEERVASRAKEIQGLKDALDTLEDAFKVGKPEKSQSFLAVRASEDQDDEMDY